MNPRSELAWTAFQARIAELGGTVTEETWLGALVPHRCICSAGHECSPRPNDIQRGNGMCTTCARRRFGIGEETFRQRIAELGGTIVEEKWLGTLSPHRCICSAGHECSPRPNHIQQGRGMCTKCARRRKFGIVEEAFRQRIAELGGTVVEEEWLGTHSPHRCICSAGHECSPRPNNIKRGKGMCAVCFVNYDRVYLVRFDDWVKVGVASGGGRLREHVSRGYSILFESSPIDPEYPLRIEKSTLRMLRSRGVEHAPYPSGVPLDGITETFPVEALPTVLRFLSERWGHVLSDLPSSLTA